jgi:hypothetical protein
MPAWPPAAAQTPSLMPMITGAWASQAICVAAKLGLADLLTGGPQQIVALARATGAQAEALGRLMRVLAGLGVFREIEPGFFASTPLGDQLRRGVPGSLRNLAMMIGDPDARRAWSDLIFSVRTGGSAFLHIFGADTFGHRADRHEDIAVFNGAMSELTRQVTDAVLAAYDFNRFRAIADIGGGAGTLLAILLAAQPGLLGILFDLPSATVGASDLLAVAGVADRCEILHGNFFEAVPRGADAYVLKSVIHDWDDEWSRIILKNCATAMPPDGRLLLIEQVLPARVEATAAHRRALLTDLNMLVMTSGRERTEAQYRDLLGSSGLEVTAINPTASSFSIIEARHGSTGQLRA